MTGRTKFLGGDGYYNLGAAHLGVPDQDPRLTREVAQSKPYVCPTRIVTLHRDQAPTMGDRTP